MKGVVVYRDGTIKIEELPMPKINEYQALVENLYCGICNGTDLKIIQGHFKGFDTYPAVLGHETVGRVVEIGKKVTSFKPGDLVLRSILEKVEDPKYHSGWGGFAEYGVVGDWKALARDGRTDYWDIYYAQQVIPGDLDPRLAIMLITLKEVASGLDRFGVSKNDAVLIHGAGPVGLSMVRLAKLRGAGPIVVSEPDSSRRGRAKRLGADVVLNPTEVDIVKEARKIVPDGFDFAIDAVGINKLITQSLKIVKFNGKVGVYGISPATKAEIDWTDAPYNWVVHFVQWPTFKDEAAVHQQVLALVQSGAINLEEFVTHVVPLEDFEKGLELIRTKEAVKVAVKIKG